MASAHDHESGAFVATGSFDQNVRIWTLDGHLMHNIFFMKAVVSLTFVPYHHAIWVTDGRKVGSCVMYTCPLLISAASVYLRSQVGRGH